MSARHWVQRAAIAYDRLRPPPPGLVVLIYHRVGGGTDSMVDLPAEIFEAQLTHLTASRDVFTLDDAVARLARGETPDGVVLTFDDGTPDFHDVAVPILQRHGVPATLYACTGPIDRGDPMPWGAPSATWDSLRTAVATGLVTIGAHTREHPLLDALDRETVADQLDTCIASITREIGTAPTHFAYPKAVPGNPAAEVEVRARFASAALAGNRVNRPGGDLHRLWRTPVHRTDTPEVFARKVRGGLRLEGIVREQVAKVRARKEHA